MGKSGAPVGNQNAAKGREWENALRKALHKRQGSLERIALKVVDEAETGDQWAIDHLANRLDGKPKQPLVGGDERDTPLFGEVRVYLPAKNP